MPNLKITMTLLVRDEEDVIEDSIRFHHAQGVDSFIVTDNLSTDSTARILRRLSREFDVQYLCQTQDDFSQSVWVTDMARLARTGHGADWVINSDADEFWVADGGDLRSFFAGLPAEIGVIEVTRHNAVVTADHGRAARASCHPRSDTIFEQVSCNALGMPLPRKVIHRGCETVRVAQGNHSVAGAPGQSVTASEALRILHFPHRTLARYRAKIMAGGRAYDRNTSLPYVVGQTWREHYKAIDSGAVEQFWETIVRPRELVTIDLAMQRLFRDTRLSNTLDRIATQQRADKLQAALVKLQRRSEALVKDFSRGVAENIDRVEPAMQPTRPLFHYLQFSLSGPNRQLEELGQLHLAGDGADLCKSFSRLRDIFSLFPRNSYMKDFFGKLASLEFPEAARRLRVHCMNKRVILHASCRSRMDRARASIASFAGQGPEYHHVLLVGQDRFVSEDEAPLAFDYDGQVLSVPMPDNYESLHRKLFYGLTILDLVAKPALVLKLDDDVRMTDGPAFDSIIETVISNGIEYAGRKVGSVLHHDQWHGWHVSKCEDPVVDGRGYQYPLPRNYAAGGYGYCLGPAGLAACSYMYLAMKAFFAMRTVGLEDVCVGHALYAQGIDLHDLTPGESLMAMRGLQTGDRTS